MRTTVISLSVVLLAACADELPQPKNWEVGEVGEPNGQREIMPEAVDITIAGEVPEDDNPRLRPLFPPHGVTTADSTPRFAWTPGEGDAALLICKQGCGEPTRLQLRDGASETTLTEALSPGLYWWWVERNDGRSFRRSLVVSVVATDREVTGHWGMRTDVDADGFADVVAVPTDGTPLAGVAYGGEGEPRSPRLWTEEVLDEQSWVATSVAAVDHNGSGIDWLVLGHPDTESITISPDYVRGRFDVVSEMQFGGFGATISAVGDVNGDGFGDVAIAPGSAEYISIVFGGTGREESSVQTIASREYLGVAIAGPADFDEDGYSDFVLTAWRGVYIAYGGPAGVDRLERLDAPADAKDGFGGSLAVGDANADGRPDIVAGESAGCFTLFWSSDDGLQPFRNCPTTQATTSQTRVALVDHDGDGRDELVTVHDEPFARCGLRSVVSIWWRLDGDGIRVFERDLPGAQLITPGDIDRDGAADAVIVLGTEIERMRDPWDTLN